MSLLTYMLTESVVVYRTFELAHVPQNQTRITPYL